MAWRYATEMTATKRDEWVGRLRAALPFASVAVLVAAIVVALVFVPQWQGDRLPDDLTAADLQRAQLLTGISDLPAPDGPFIHLKAAQRTKRLFVTASSRFRALSG